MPRSTLPTFAVVFLLTLPVAAADLRIAPAEVPLVGPRAAQQLVVFEEVEGRATADKTPAAKFTSSHPAVAAVDADGRVRAVGDGEAVVTATIGGRKTSATVRVTKTNQPAVRNFRNHVEPILTRTGCNSGACHGALAGKGGFKLSLRGYDPDSDHFALTRQALGRRVDSQQPADSLVLKKATRTVPHGGGTRIAPDSDHYQVLSEWIAAGAPGPDPADATLTRIEVYPKAALLKPKDIARVIVRAFYSDGTIADATRLAKFTSSEEQVAAVDEDGTISVAGHGEAGVAALFGGRVAVVTVTAPYPNSVTAAAFDQVRKVNFIDGLILGKLKLLNLEPSPDCTDAEFIRRASLDACGILPTSEEVAAFLADPTPNKRARLIDKLLDRPEFVDYWAHKWSDLLLVSSRKLPQPAMWAFYRAVRQSVADNQPWDQFAREILTASGSTLAAGGGNYFVLHKDVTELVESTSVTFLGMSIQCARCHNHPLEKWTQDQYWGQANLFSRVGLKNGGRAGDVVVHALASGDALHPRRGTAVPPTPLDGKPLSPDSTADRRRYFADWLTAPDNPYFAKAVVNRVWRNFMGRGLVEAEDDLRDTNPSTNPELFAALADDFVAHKYDVKHLARTILNSAAYQRSSRPLPGNAADDRFYSRYLIRRLSAEVILDAYADITGVPTPFDVLSLGPSGGTAGAAYPSGTRAMQLPDSLLVSRFLDAFGRAGREQTCSCERTADSSVGQALHLNNGQTLNDKLRGPNSVLSKWLAGNAADAEIVDRVFHLGLSRAATADEKKQFLAILSDAGKVSPDARREALEDVFWAVLTGKEFLFNH
ncbi:DUF1553 domain-containing protein [Fimbriiglobus ruber]|uniref:BIG2 domain-containing protein n=1 Tax=Fimbriiglobus ruber TaxID=1908690 RepID=A0A225EA48_9BACT|nr:DUF1553 domain-containing protein [Fimbriiglobus ruber]OWK46906.1 hypothetical protein FRUB_00605 [Fimbriiglobus ruber]